MRLIEFTDEVGVSDVVRIDDTSTGKGVFALRRYPGTAVIGEITGELIRNGTYGSNYAFDLEDGLLLEPFEPFRFVNHSCDPNCEFDWVEDRDARGLRVPTLYLVALRDIFPQEQLTIDYSWPASNAIPCDCRSPLCRGWIVATDELRTIYMQPQQPRSPQDNSKVPNR